MSCYFSKAALPHASITSARTNHETDLSSVGVLLCEVTHCHWGNIRYFYTRHPLTDPRFFFLFFFFFFFFLLDAKQWFDSTVREPNNKLKVTDAHRATSWDLFSPFATALLETTHTFTSLVCQSNPNRMGLGTSDRVLCSVPYCMCLLAAAATVVVVVVSQFHHFSVCWRKGRQVCDGWRSYGRRSFAPRDIN